MPDKSKKRPSGGPPPGYQQLLPYHYGGWNPAWGGKGLSPDSSSAVMTNLS